MRVYKILIRPTVTTAEETWSLTKYDKQNGDMGEEDVEMDFW